MTERIVARDNLKKALAQVRRNKGAPGVDGMAVDDLAAYLKDHWPEIRAQLLDGTYQPQPVRRVEIPKASGGTRGLGIPSVLDRFIQQAVMQVLQEDWDPTFSPSSYGFRPGRSAHQAVAAAQQMIADGCHIVVDIDLEKVFDRVNHDILMGLVAKRVQDRPLLQLIRRYLTAGVLVGGMVDPGICASCWLSGPPRWSGTPGTSRTGRIPASWRCWPASRCGWRASQWPTRWRVWSGPLWRAGGHTRPVMFHRWWDEPESIRDRAGMTGSRRL